VILESISGPVPCARCGALAEWCGTQVLGDDDSLRWDTEVMCPACGEGMAVCGGELPDATRERMLAERGRAVVRVRGAVDRVAVMRVLRHRFPVGPAEVKGLLEQILEGELGGTLPEAELLVRRLRAAGVDAVAARRAITPDVPADE
jgi:hypothetical protein